MRKPRPHKPTERVKQRRKPIRTRKPLFRGFDNTRDLDTILGHTKIYQDVLGITREDLSTLFEQAQAFLQANRIEEAESAYSLLTKINPFAADFWIGLGAAKLLHEEFLGAFDAFMMALTMDPSRYETYAYAIECCVSMKNYQQAEALLKQAVTYAKRHRSRAQSAIILDEAPRIFQEIAIEKSHL